MSIILVNQVFTIRVEPEPTSIQPIGLYRPRRNSPHYGYRLFNSAITAIRTSPCDSIFVILGSSNDR